MPLLTRLQDRILTVRGLDPLLSSDYRITVQVSEYCPYA